MNLLDHNDDTAISLAMRSRNAQCVQELLSVPGVHVRPRRMILSASSQRRIDSRTDGAATGGEGDFGGEKAGGGRGGVSVPGRVTLGTHAEHGSVGGAAAVTPGRAILVAGRGQEPNTEGEQGREPGQEIQSKPLLVHPRHRRRLRRGRGHGRGAHAALSSASNDAGYHDDFEGDLGGGGGGGSVYIPSHAATWPPAQLMGGRVADVDGIVPRRPATATGSSPWGHRHRHQQRALRAYEKAVAVTSSVHARPVRLSVTRSGAYSFPPAVNVKIGKKKGVRGERERGEPAGGEGRVWSPGPASPRT